MNIGLVIGWKFNHQSGMSTYDGVITEFPDGIPSQSDQDKWTAEYEAYLISIAYSVNRKKAYDKLNQFELMSDDSINGTTTHKDAILKVKSDYPKPE